MITPANESSIKKIAFVFGLSFKINILRIVTMIGDNATIIPAWEEGMYLNDFTDNVL